MVRPPITFRLTEHECQLLEYAKQEGESINQTAARLLREKLGIRQDESSQLDEHLLDVVITEKVNARVENLKMWIEDYVDTAVNNKVNERITAESKPRTPRKTPTKTADKQSEV